MKWVARIGRFVTVTLLCAMAFSVLARMLTDLDDPWTTGLAVWAASLALAATDLYFRLKDGTIR